MELVLGFELAKVCERGALPQRRVDELSAVTLQTDLVGGVWVRLGMKLRLHGYHKHWQDKE